MKQLISLLLIVAVTIISWSSYAKNKVINVTTIHNISYPVATSSLMASTFLSTLEINENVNFPQDKVESKHNRFFELSIIFNEKLQQLISFYTHSDHENNDAINNSLPSYNYN